MSTDGLSRADDRNVLFISYAHADRDLCGRVSSFLRHKAAQLGYEIWWDNSLVPGRAWRPELDDAIERAGACILLTSLATIESSFIWDFEIPRFRSKGIPIAPVYADDCDFGGHWLDAQTFLDPPGRQVPLSRYPDGEAAALSEISRSLHTWLPPVIARGARPSTRTSVEGEAVSASPAEFEPGSVYGVPAPPLDYQPREELLAEFKEAILSAGPGAAAISSDPPSALGLHGSGGTGKSVMAAAVATDTDVRRAFPDGIFWITVGKERRNIDAGQSTLAQWLDCDISAGRTPNERRKLLAEALVSKRCLVVVDDIWTGASADAFNVAGPLTRVLFTTRQERLLSARDIGARSLRVDRYNRAEALEFLARATDTALPLPAEAERVAYLTDGVVLSLCLAAGAFRHGLGWRLLLDRWEDSQRLFPEDEQGNMRAMRVALSTLTDDQRLRYHDLVVFEPDIPIPVATIDRFWRYVGDEDPAALLDLFENGGLLSLDGDYVRFHDDQLFYLQANADQAIHRHDELLNSFRQDNERWSDLDDDEPYLWDHLVHHLIGAMEALEAEELALDLRWIARRWSLAGAGAVERDLGRLCSTLPTKHAAQRLHRRLRQAAHLLTGLKDPAEIANTLAVHTLDLVVNGGPLGDAKSSLRSLTEGTWLGPQVPTWTSSDALVKVFNGHRGGVNTVVGLPRPLRSQVASGGRDGTVQVWDELIPDSDPVVLAGHTQAVLALAEVVHEGSPWLASAGADRFIALWDLDDLDAPPLRLRGNSSAVRALAGAGDDGRYLLVSGGDDRQVRLWHADDLARPPSIIGRHDGTVIGLATATTDDGLVVLAVTDDGRRAIWREAEEGRFVLVSERLHEEAARAGGLLERRLTGLEATTSAGRTVTRWAPLGADTTIGPLGATVLALTTIEGDVRRLVMGCSDGIVRVWDEEASGTSLHGLHGHIGNVLDVASLTSGRMLIASASDDGSVCVWDPHLIDPGGGDEGMRPSPLTATAVIPGDPDRLVACTSDGDLAVWDLHSPFAAPSARRSHGSTVRAVHLAEVGPTPSIAFGADDGLIWAGRLIDGELEVSRLPGEHTGFVRAVTTVEVDGDAQVLSGGNDRKIIIRRADGTGSPRVLEGHHSRVLVLHVADRDGQRTLLSGAADGTVRCWDLQHLPTHTTVELGHEPVLALTSFAGPNGLSVAAGRKDGVVEWWPIEAPAARATLRPLESSVIGLTSVPGEDGADLLAVLSTDGLVELWDPVSSAPAPQARLRVGSQALSIAAHPDRRRLVVAFDATWTVLDLGAT